MAVMQVLDEAKEQIDAALRQRVAPDDEVRWDLSLTMAPVICHGDEDDEEAETHIHSELVYSLFVSLGCPETETSIAVCTSLPHCPDLDMDWWVDRVWTHLSVRRIGLAEFDDDDDIDFDDDDCLDVEDDDGNFGVTF